MADLARLRGAAFLVLGRAGMDLMPDPTGTPIETARSFVPALGGSAANIAAALVRLGCRASLVTRVSGDAVGRFCLAELDRFGIDRTHVGLAAGGDARTSLALSESRLAGHQTVIYRNGAADFGLTEADVGSIDLSAFGALVVTGTAFAAEPSRSAAFRALDRGRAAGLLPVIDLDYRPYSWTSPEEAAAVCGRAAGFCDVVVGNDVEFGILAGATERGRDLARAMAAARGGTAIYKMGERGAVTFEGDREIRTGVFRTDPLKPTGAGDAFLGALLAALAAGCSVEAAVLRGSAAAAIVVGRVGCAPAMPDAAELEAFMAGHPGPTTA